MGKKVEYEDNYGDRIFTMEINVRDEDICTEVHGNDINTEVLGYDIDMEVCGNDIDIEVRGKLWIEILQTHNYRFGTN